MSDDEENVQADVAEDYSSLILKKMEESDKLINPQPAVAASAVGDDTKLLELPSLA